MTYVAIVCATLLFGAVVYAIRRGFGVKTAMKLLGVSFTFEAEKQDRVSRPQGVESSSRS